MSQLDEKTRFATELLEMGATYREIQRILKQKFGSGMSNNTLQKIKTKIEHSRSLAEENKKLRRELSLYKQLYFELLDKVQGILPAEFD